MGKRRPTKTRNSAGKRSSAPPRPSVKKPKALDYRRLFELAGDAILVVDGDRRYIEANEAAVQLTGYSRRELLQRGLGDLTTQEERPALQRHFEEIRRTGRSSRLATLVRKDGTRLRVEGRAIDMGGGISLGIIRDVSDRLEAERALQLSHESFAALVELCPDAVISADAELRITVWNPAAESMFGYSAKEAARLTVPELLPRHLHAQITEARQALLTLPEGTHWSRTMILDVLRKDGSELPVEAAIGVGVRGAQAVATAVVRDITLHRRMFEKLNDALQRLQFHVDRMPLGYVVLDDKFRFTEWNPAAEHIFGYTRDEAMGMEALAIIPPDEHPTVQRIFAEVMAGDTSSHSINDNVRKDGTRITCEWYNTPLRDGHGRIIALAAMCMDITERELRATQVLNMQKLESLGVLASGFAHDFNSSLMVILGNAALLKSLKGLPQRAAEHLSMIEEAGSKANDLVKHILAYARTGRHNPQLTPLNDVIRDAEVFIRSSIGKQIDLELNLSDDLAPLLLDRSQVHQILLNLCINAKQAMRGPGTITIITRRAALTPADLVRCVPDGAKAGSYVELCVSDEGCGMSAATRTRIFDPFFTTKPDGHGLGLAAVLGILRQHHAFVCVESEEGSGTTFHVYLPLPMSQTSRITEKPRARKR